MHTCTVARSVATGTTRRQAAAVPPCFLSSRPPTFTAAKPLAPPSADRGTDHGEAESCARGQRRVNSRRRRATRRRLQFKVAARGWPMICRYPLIRQMTRRPPMTPAGPGRAGAGVRRPGTRLQLSTSINSTPV